KADNGGGGRGMRIARGAGGVESAVPRAGGGGRGGVGGGPGWIERQSERAVDMEKLVEGGGHVAIQFFAARYGPAVHFGERDCTVQRNHQKLVEESPSPALSADQRAAACQAAARAAETIGYTGAGTMEMLLDSGTLRFMEMNCRLQVEHTI